MSYSKLLKATSMEELLRSLEYRRPSLSTVLICIVLSPILLFLLFLFLLNQYEVFAQFFRMELDGFFWNTGLFLIFLILDFGLLWAIKSSYERKKIEKNFVVPVIMITINNMKGLPFSEIKSEAQRVYQSLFIEMNKNEKKLEKTFRKVVKYTFIIGFSLDFIQTFVEHTL